MLQPPSQSTKAGQLLLLEHPNPHKQTTNIKPGIQSLQAHLFPRQIKQLAEPRKGDEVVVFGDHKEIVLYHALPAQTAEKCIAHRDARQQATR